MTYMTFSQPVTCPCPCGHTFVPEPLPPLPSQPVAPAADFVEDQIVARFLTWSRTGVPAGWRGTSAQLFALFHDWRGEHDPNQRSVDVPQRLLGTAAIAAGWTWKRSAAGRVYSPPRYAIS